MPLVVTSDPSVAESVAAVPVTTSPASVMVPGIEIAPPLLSVAVAEGVCAPWVPAPVMIAVLVRDAPLVTHVVQAIVPVLVIGPPVIGELVATLVTVPVEGVAAVTICPLLLVPT